MKPIVLTLFSAILPLHAQQAPPPDSGWTVEIPGPIADGTPSPPKAKPAPIDFSVLTSRTKRIERVDPPPMHGLPPVRGLVNVTVRMVEAPDLPEPPPLPNLPPADPAVIARLRESAEKHRGTGIAYISATVYDRTRTFLRIYPGGKTGREVTAWSNIDFSHFGGFSSYRVNYADGSFRDHGLLMGIDNTRTGRIGHPTARTGRNLQPSGIPALPGIAAHGPAFLIVSGDADGPAADILRQTHQLYRLHGKTMEEKYHARARAAAEQRARLIANPPKPKDLRISFWNRKPAGTVDVPHTEESR